MAVFWVVAPCSLVKFTDVSEVLVASIMRKIIAIFILAAVRISKLSNFSPVSLLILV
jgi:hypothetical protein